MPPADLLRDALIALIFAESDQRPDGAVGRNTPLITSGRLDSAQLLQMLLWIEEKTGRPIDATAIDMAAEWNTVDAIVAFVERERRNV